MHLDYIQSIWIIKEIAVIVIPMLGRSSRFFNAGYSIPKYQLPLGGETVFTKVVRSFEGYFNLEHFLFLVRTDHNDVNFVSKEAKRLGLNDYRIIEFQNETQGQAESVALGLVDYPQDAPLIIFNIDTIRHGFQLLTPDRAGDGYLEVFIGHGDGWSFIEAGPNNSVVSTTEKQRISKYCSNGLYYFASKKIYLEAYHKYLKSGLMVHGELYIAPLYNMLIETGYKINFNLIDSNEIDHCGLPNDYETLKMLYV